MERLEINNPDHISKVKEYEIKHGYNRITGYLNDKKNYKVSFNAPCGIVAKATVYVEAINEDEAEKLALMKVDFSDFEVDDSDEDIDFGAREIIHIAEEL